MNNVKIVFNEEDMIYFIKDLMCLENESTWKRHTTDSKTEIKFVGNIHKVQKTIYGWLSAQPRKHNFELFGEDK